MAEAEDAKLAAALAGGSPRRFIELTRRNGVELYRLMRRAHRGRRSPGAVQAVGARRRCGRHGAGSSSSSKAISAAGCAACRSPARGDSAGRAACHLAELWEKAAVSGLEVEEYNLDRRQFVLDLLETAAAAVPSSRDAEIRTSNRA